MDLLRNPRTELRPMHKQALPLELHEPSGLPGRPIRTPIYAVRPLPPTLFERVCKAFGVAVATQHMQVEIMCFGIRTWVNAAKDAVQPVSTSSSTARTDRMMAVC